MNALYLMQLFKSKNFCHLRRELENFQADFELSRHTIEDLKQTVSKLKYDKEADRDALMLLKNETRKLIKDKMTLRSSFDEVSVKYEGLKIKYDDLKGSYFSLKASYCDLKHDVGKMQGQLNKLDADGRLRKFEDSLNKKESFKVAGYSDVKYDSRFRSQYNDKYVGEYYPKYKQKYDAKYVEKYDENFNCQFGRFPDQNNNSVFTRPIYQDHIYSNDRSVEIRSSYLSQPSKRKRLNSRNEHNEPIRMKETILNRIGKKPEIILSKSEKMLKSGDVYKQDTCIYQNNSVERKIPVECSLLKDTYAKEQQTERFSKYFKRNDLNELIFNSQMNAKKKATNWADYIDECIR